MTTRRGFTLIELLVVIAIITVLSGLLMPMVAMARKRAASSNTLALLRKVETGLELFKGELDTYPWQAHDPALTFPEVDNRLAWVLAHDLDATEHADLNADLATARAAYAPGGAHALDKGDVDPRIGRGGGEVREIYAQMVNRMAIERATLAVLAGNLAVGGIHKDRSVPVVPNPASRGYAFDFLSVDLNPGDVRGETIVDLWGRPLVYNCPVVQGVRGFYPPGTINKGWGSVSENEPPIDPGFYGMETEGRTATRSKGTDQRTHAARGFEHRFELWSAGEDGLIEPYRADPENRDNLAPTDYQSGLL